MHREKILFVYKEPSTFVKTDRQILAEKYDITDYCFHPVRGIGKTALEMAKQLIFLLLNGWKFDKTYIWFADYHSFLPVWYARLFGKKSFLVIGGYDICRERSLTYGAFCSKFRGFFTAQSIKKATVNLTVSKYVDRKVGFVFPKVKHEMIYNCINMQTNETAKQKEKLILCVALIESQRTFLRKGIDTFLELAVHVPDYRLVLIGPNKAAMALFPNPLPENVSVFERLPHAELASYFEKASFYCQLSRVEIFGIAIGEAMLNYCIPLVTNEGGMPEVVEKTGVIVPRDAQKIAEEIRKLETMDTTAQRAACRNRILELFSLEQRTNALLEAIEKY